jgi:hypothetical protein
VQYVKKCVDILRCVSYNIDRNRENNRKHFHGGEIMGIFVAGTLVYLATISIMLYNGLNA